MRKLINVNEKLIKSNHIKETMQNKDYVIFNTNTGLFYGLQDTSAFVWELIDGEHSAKTIISNIINIYEGSNEEVIFEDIVELINNFKEEGLIL